MQCGNYDSAECGNYESAGEDMSKNLRRFAPAPRPDSTAQACGIAWTCYLTALDEAREGRDLFEALMAHLTNARDTAEEAGLGHDGVMNVSMTFHDLVRASHPEVARLSERLC